MGLIGSIAGGALGAVGSIFGGIKASKAMRRAKRNIEAQKQANQNGYDRRYNENATQRADAQQILAKIDESIRNRNKQAAGAQAVMGGTDESTAAAKAANAQALSEAASQIAVNADNRKDQIEQQYQQRNANYDAQLNQLELDKAKAIGQAVQGVAQAGAGVANAF